MAANKQIERTDGTTLIIKPLVLMPAAHYALGRYTQQIKIESMLGLKEKNDVIPKCPHCSVEVKEVWYRELKNILGKRYIYFCSSCQKVLGISHRKGFFMG